MLKILTTDLKWRGDIDDYSSLQFIKRWHDVGEFELHINRHANGVSELQKNRIVMLTPSKAGIIKHREIELDENGKETENWVFKGYDLKGVFSQRLTLPPSTTAYDNKQGPAETVMKHYVNNNAIEPADRKRKFIMMRMNDDLGAGGTVKWQSRYKVLAEELRDISLADGIGWDVYLDVKAGWWTFDTFEGRDLSHQNAEGHSPVFFSHEFGNVRSIAFTDSDLNKRNVAFVAGQGEGENREIIELGEASDIDRIETFIDARDVDQDGGSNNGETLEQRGSRLLAQQANEMYLECEVLTPTDNAPFVYEKDYFLGDIVTVMNRDWGVAANQRITEAKEIYEANGFRLELTFGQKRPTLISKLNDKFSQHDNVLKR